MSLGDLIKLHSMNSVRSLRLLDLVEAEVASAPPELQLKLKGNDRLIIPKELIVVAEHLCEVKRKINLTRGGKSDEVKVEEEEEEEEETEAEDGDDEGQEADDEQEEEQEQEQEPEQEQEETYMSVGKDTFDMTIAKTMHAIPPPAVDEMHDHSSTLEVALTNRSFAMTEGELHYINDDKNDDLLKKGDKVMVATFEGGQKFFVIDRIVHY